MAESGQAPDIRVAIVEDRVRTREGIQALIDGTPGYQCAGSFGSMEEALDAIDRDPPKVVLLDIALPGMSGIEGIRRLKERYPGMLLMMLTVYDGLPSYVRMSSVTQRSPLPMIRRTVNRFLFG